MRVEWLCLKPLCKSLTIYGGDYLNPVERAAKASRCLFVRILYALDYPLEILSGNSSIIPENTPKTLAALVNPEDLPAVMEELSDLSQSDDECISLHFRMKQGGGDYSWVHLEGEIERNDGRLAAINGMIMDVSQYLEASGDDPVLREFKKRSLMRIDGIIRDKTRLSDILETKYLTQIQKPFSQIKGLYSAIYDAQGELIAMPKGQDKRKQLDDFEYHTKKSIRVDHDDAATWIIASENPVLVVENTPVLETLAQTVSKLANAFVMILRESDNAKNANKLLSRSIEEQIFLTNVYSIILESEETTQAINKLLELAGEYFKLDRIRLYREMGDKLQPVLDWGGNGILPKSLCLSDFPHIEKRLEEDGICFSEKGDEEFSSEIKSFAAAQLMEQSESGGIMLYACLAEREWNRREKKLFKTLTQIFSTILMRLGVERMLENSQNALKTLAYIDNITKIPNRASYEKKLSAVVKEGEGAILAFEIINLKQIAEFYGHSYCDLLIKSIAQYLDAMPIEGKSVYRYSSDLFIIILENADSSRAKELAEALIYKYKKPWYLGENQHFIQTATGISLYPDNGTDPSEVSKAAVLAMYRAKEFSQNSYAFYARGLRQQQYTNHRIEEQLRNAVLGDFSKFSLAFQPVISRNNGLISSAELFIRWTDDELGCVMPGHFMAIAEYLGIDHVIDAWVVDNACAYCAEMQAAGFPDFAVSVNLTTQELQGRSIVNTVKAALETHKLPPKSLILEIPEKSQLHTINDSNAVLHRLKRLGVRIAADSFAKEYLTLGSLRSSYIDIVKLEKELFIHDDDLFSKTLANSIIYLSHSKNISVCVKGIELESELSLLDGFKVDELQGYLIAEPMSGDELKDYVSAHRPDAADGVGAFARKK